MRFVPYDYQRYAINYILTHRACGLFLEMGLGKTVITLTAVKKLLADLMVTRVLVIAPLRVAQTVWAEEAEKWEHLSGLRFSKVLGSSEDRRAALAADADIYVINRENVTWLAKEFKPGEWPFDMCVIDELSSFKSSQAQRFRALKRLSFDRIVGLTGTPAPNGLIDLWPQVFLLDHGERLGKFVGQYRAEFFRPGLTINGVVCKYNLRDGAEQEIYRRLKDLCVSMKAEDYVKLPARMPIEHKVQLTGLERELYDRFEREMVLAMDDEEITALSAAALCGKLCQLANGAVYDENKMWHDFHSRKLDALEDIIEAANGNPVLVYYTFRHDAERIRKRFPEAVQLSSADDVRDWNAGKIPLLLAHPDSAGHGLNLQRGGHILVWFGLTWSLEKYQQANARLHRQGQQHAVLIHHIVAEGTVDEQIMRALAGKEQKQDALLSAVKARIEAVRNES